MDSTRRLVEYLCSEECAGRETGTVESENARAAICVELDKLGLEPAGVHRWLQPLPEIGGANILARIPGKHGGGAYWGADDNAAAVALLIDTARGLVERADELGREVLLAWFDAEEPPHFMSRTMGSTYFVENPTTPLERVDAMICMDLMGHAIGDPLLPPAVRDSVFVLGAEKSFGTGALLDELAKSARGLHPRRMASEVIPAMSDYLAFEQARIPFLFLTCGRWRHYHQPTDTPEKLDYSKINSSSNYLQEIVLAMSARAADRIEFLPEGRDDEATLNSLRELAEALVPFSAQAKLALQTIDALSAKAQTRAGLGERERAAIAALVHAIESALE